MRIHVGFALIAVVDRGHVLDRRVEVDGIFGRITVEPDHGRGDCLGVVELEDVKLVRVFELVGRNVNVVSQEGPGLLGDHDLRLVGQVCGSNGHMVSQVSVVRGGAFTDLSLEPQHDYEAALSPEQLQGSVIPDVYVDGLFVGVFGGLEGWVEVQRVDEASLRSVPQLRRFVLAVGSIQSRD